MAIPTISALFDESLEGDTREGRESLRPAGAIQWEDSFRTERRKVSPVLVASPDLTEDEQGPLQPKLSSTVTLGQGPQGKTWKLKNNVAPPPIAKMSPSDIRIYDTQHTEFTEATENLVLNPSFEAGMDNLRIYTQGFTRILSTDDVMFGSSALKLTKSPTSTATTSYAYFTTPDGSVKKGKPHTVSMYLKTNRYIEGGYFRVQYRRTGTSGYPLATETVFFDPRNEWYRIEATLPEAPEDCWIAFWFNIPSEQFHEGDFLIIDGLQVEAKAYASPYCDGDQGEGHAWTGTPHASTSTRAAASGLEGAINSARGPMGAAWLIENTKTNLLPNPIVKENAAYWSQWSTTGTTTVGSRVTDQLDMGEACWQVELVELGDISHTLSAYFYTYDDLGWTGEARTFIASCTMKSVKTISVETYMRLHYADGQVDGPRLSFTVGTTPTRLHTTPNTLDPNRELRRISVFVVYTAELSEGERVWLTEGQIEENSHPSSFFHGDMGEGYSWEGEPHKSPSIRSIGRVHVPTDNFSLHRGSVFFWYQPRMFYDDNRLKYLFSLGRIGGTDANNITVYYRNNTINLRDKSATGRLTETVTELDQWYLGYLEWTPERIGVDWGLGNGYRSMNRVAYERATYTYNTLYISDGHVDPRWENPFESPVGPFLFFRRPLTEQERAWVQARQEWEWDELQKDKAEVQIGHLATTNLRENPSNEIQMSRIGTTSLGMSYELDSEVKFSGETSIRCDSDGSAATAGIQMLTPSGIGRGGSEVFSLQMRIKAPTANFFSIGGFVRYTDNTTGYLNGGKVTVEPDGSEWQLYEFTGATDVGKTVDYITYHVTTHTWDSPITFWVDDVQIERLPFPTPFFTGDDPDAEWVGEPHDSYSVHRGRGRIREAKTFFVRYIEDGERKMTMLRGAGPIGENGYMSVKGGTLRFFPKDDREFEVESVVAYDVDASPVRDRLEELSVWTRDACTFGMDVPAPALKLEQTTTNLINNPYLIPSIGGFAPNNGEIEYVDWDAPQGFDHCYAFTGDGESSFQYLHVAGAVPEAKSGNPSRSFTGSAWVKAEAGTPFALVLWQRGYVNGSFTNGQKSEWFTGTGEWQRVSVTGETVQGNDLRSGIMLSVATSFVSNSPRPSATVYTTGFQVEEVAYPTSFTPRLDALGLLQEGYSWEERAFNSPSTRTIGRVFGLANNAQRGAIAIRFKLGENHTSNSYVFSSGGTTTTFLSMNNSGQRLRVTLYIDGTSYGHLFRWSDPLPEGDIITAIYQWDDDWLTLYLHDGQVISATIPTERPLSNTLLRIGSYGSSFSSNSTFYNLAQYDRPLTEAERKKLFESDVWEFDTLFPSPERVIRRQSPSPIGVIRQRGEE